MVTLGASLLPVQQLVTTLFESVYGWHTGLDQFAVTFAVRGVADSLAVLLPLQAILCAWVVIPGIRKRVRDPPDVLSRLPDARPISSRAVVIAAALIVVAGPSVLAFSGGFQPVTRLETPGGTFEEGGVAVTVTDVRRADCAKQTCTLLGEDTVTTNLSHNEVILVYIRTENRGHDGQLIEAAGLVTPAAEGDNRITDRTDTVREEGSAGSLTAGEVTAETIRIGERDYDTYEPSERTVRSHDGWMLFRPPPEAESGSSYILIVPEGGGSAGKWPA